MSISLEPTTSCNLRCPECPSGMRAFTRPTGMLNLDNFRMFLEQFRGPLLSINFYFQGEPYLNRDLIRMIAIADEMKIYTSTSTNAHFLDTDTARKTVESGLKRLIISIDGLTQESYEQYRIGGKLDKVIEGTKNLIYWKRVIKSEFPRLIFQFLVVRHNEHQINQVLQLGKELGVDDVRLKTAQVYDFENGNKLIPSNKTFSRYRLSKNGKWILKNKMYNHCWRMWQGCVVTWDSAVVPCCFDKDAAHQMGSLINQPFDKIWKGSSYQRFRRSIFKSRKEIDICKNCTEGTKVWV